MTRPEHADARGATLPLRAILTDFDGVIRRWPASRVRAIERDAGLPPGAILATAFSPDLLRPAITGRVSDGAWRERVAARLSELHPGTDARHAVAAWSASPGRVDRTVLDLLRSCRTGLRVVLVSNATSRLPRDLDRLGIANAFDAVVASCDVGAVKPQAAMYREALRRAGARADEAFFVDDNESNVAAAAALGMHAHAFTGVVGLRRALRGLGVP